jgi:hypothetical protein
MFGELPDAEIATRISPAPPFILSWKEKTSSYPMSFAIAVKIEPEVRGSILGLKRAS